MPFPSLGHFPDPGIQLMSPTLAGRFFSTEPLGKLKPTPLQLYNSLRNLALSWKGKVAYFSCVWTGQGLAPL